MNYSEALSRLGELRDIFGKLRDSEKTPSDQFPVLSDEGKILYGELEEVILSVTGVQKVEVEVAYGYKAVFSNYIEAALFSSQPFYNSEGYNQLLKVYGRIQRLAQDPIVPQPEQAVTHLVEILGRYRECCQYIRKPPEDEKAVQDIVWIMLRSQFDRVEREETFQKFGNKSYRPDFGIPDLRTLIEVKYIGEKTNVSSIQDEILTDIPAYLSSSIKYTGILVLVYDQGQKLRDPRKFIEDIQSVEGILNVQVIPGIG